MQFTAVFMPVPEGYVAFTEALPGANTQGATNKQPATLRENRDNLGGAVGLVCAANRALAGKSHVGRDVSREPFHFTT